MFSIARRQGLRRAIARPQHPFVGGFPSCATESGNTILFSRSLLPRSAGFAKQEAAPVKTLQLLDEPSIAQRPVCPLAAGHLLGQGRGGRGEAGFPWRRRSISCRNHPTMGCPGRRGARHRMGPVPQVSTSGLLLMVTCPCLTWTMGVPPRCGPDARCCTYCSRRGGSGQGAGGPRFAVAGRAKPA